MASCPSQVRGRRELAGYGASMHRFLALLLLCPACVFKLPGDVGSSDSSPEDSMSDGAETLGGSTTSGGGGTGDVPEDSSTSAAPGSTTSTGGPLTTTTEPPTTTAGDETAGGTGEPLPGPLMVYVLHAEAGPKSGFEDVLLWQSGNVESCQDAPPVDCGEPPVIGAPKLLVDGDVLGPDAVKAGSRVGVIFPYAHPACALGCGEYTADVLIGQGGDGVGAIGLFPVDLPCSTEAGFVWLGVDFSVVSLPEEHSVELVLTDRCGVSSQAQKVVFTPK